MPPANGDLFCFQSIYIIKRYIMYLYDLGMKFRGEIETSFIIIARFCDIKLQLLIIQIGLTLL